MTDNPTLIDGTEMRCDDCRYYALSPGECRRHSPIVDWLSARYGEPMWPHVYSHHWCGDFEVQKIPSGAIREDKS